MILINCAACAAPLAHNAPRCVRCSTRYCNKTCQMRGALECATEKVLRFPVGTRVECAVFGGWHKGVVVKHRYRKASMSYEIRLDRSCRIVVPHDDDRSIRRAID